MAEQLVCLESLRCKTSCPQDTKKMKNKDERKEKQNGIFLHKARAI